MSITQGTARVRVRELSLSQGIWTKRKKANVNGYELILK